jgi:hypothetical protein
VSRTHLEADRGAVDREVGGGAREGAGDEVGAEAEVVAARRGKAREPRLPAKLAWRACHRQRRCWRDLRRGRASSTALTFMPCVA